MSFNTSKELNYFEDINLNYTCCSVGITYNVEPAGTVTSCMPGTDASAERHACNSARAKATTLIAYNNENGVTP